MSPSSHKETYQWITGYGPAHPKMAACEFEAQKSSDCLLHRVGWLWQHLIFAGAEILNKQALMQMKEGIWLKQSASRQMDILPSFESL